MTFEISITAIGICRAAAIILGAGMTIYSTLMSSVVESGRDAFLVLLGGLVGLCLIAAGVIA